MRVLLINTNRVRPPVGPLGLDYIGSALDRAGHRVRLLDLCWEPAAEPAVRAALEESRPDLVALSFRNSDDCYFATRHSFVPRLQADVQAVRRAYDGPLVLGGGGLSCMPRRLLSLVGECHGVCGDGEQALPALCQALEGRLPLSAVPGLVFGEDGAWRVNPRAEADPGTLSLASRRLVDNRRYFREGGQAGLETKRGCPGRCIYCADPVIKGHRPRLRPPADVVAEVRDLLDQGIDVLHLCDSELNQPPDHAEAVCQALIDSGLGGRVRWYAYASPAPFPPSLAWLARRAGCVGINFGVDSGDDAMLCRLGRTHTADDIRQTLSHCRGMELMCDLLIGAPGETPASVARSIRLMRELAPDAVGLSLGLRVYPGTPIWRALDRRHLSPDGLQGDLHDTAPAYYLDPALGEDPFGDLRLLIGDDERFLLPCGKDQQDYNYNDNSLLQQAIQDGERGAYWSILRRRQG
jgi:radical SAM superfamily enzyme YgiQ (UPF0313 family)